MLLQNTLKSNKFGLWLAIITAIIEGSHSAYVFTFMSAFEKPYNIVHSIIMASVITGAIIFYTLRNKLRIAKFFAYYEGFMNLFYYVTFIVIQDRSWWLLVMAIPTAIILPITLYYYAEEIKESKEIDNELQDTINDIYEDIEYSTNKLHSLTETTELLTKTSANIAEHLDNLQQKVDTQSVTLEKEMKLQILKRDEKLMNYDVILTQKELPSNIENNSR